MTYGGGVASGALNIIVGGIAKTHDGNTCGHHAGSNPESADDIVAFALAIPLSKENGSSSTSDKALDMFLLMKVGMASIYSIVPLL